MPKAYSIVNPNRLDDKSNLNYLCAAGVSFMFLISLNKDLRSIQWFNKKKIKEPNLLNYLDLVSLGTVCDVVRLIGLNRALVKRHVLMIAHESENKRLHKYERVSKSTLDYLEARLKNEIREMHDELEKMMYSRRIGKVAIIIGGNDIHWGEEYCKLHLDRIRSEYDATVFSAIPKSSMPEPTIRTLSLIHI